MIQRQCGCNSGKARSSQSPGNSLADVFRVLSHVNHPTLVGAWTSKWFPSAVRDLPGVPVSVVNQSQWQPINVPAPVQVSYASEYKMPWAFDGSVFARHQEPYQAPPGAMQAPWAGYGFSVATNQYSTVPWILAVGQQNNQGGR
jgi:hypothetical protein